MMNYCINNDPDNVWEDSEYDVEWDKYKQKDKDRQRKLQSEDSDTPDKNASGKPNP